MRTLTTALTAAIAGLAVVGASNAFAAHQTDPYPVDYAHRSHAATYDDDRPADPYYRARPYRNSGVNLSITVGHDYYNRGHRYNHGYDYKRRNGYRGRKGRIINREVFDTRYRARIVLIEEAIRTRRGPRLVCTVKARGPEAGYVSERRMHRIARNYCSPRARVRVFA